MKNKKPIIALCALAVLGLVGATIAYFTSEVVLDNTFTTATYKTKTTETFQSPDDWLPGQTTPKTVVTENEGTVPVAVRASLSEKWTLSDGTTVITPSDLPYVIGSGTSAVTITDFRDYTTINTQNIGTGSNEWTLSNGYYYFNRALAAKNGNTVDSTTSFLASVTLNADVASSQDCTSTGAIGQGTYTMTCTTSIDGLGDATYTLTVTVETVQADKYKTAWSISTPQITGGEQ